MPKGSNKSQKWNILQNNGLISSTSQIVKRGILLSSKRWKRCDQVQMQEWEIVAKNVLGYWKNVNKKYLIQPLDENIDMECWPN